MNRDGTKSRCNKGERAKIADDTMAAIAVAGP